MGKVRKRLTIEEASFLGLALKKVEDGRKRARYTITDDQWQDVFEKRNEGVLQSCNDLKVDSTTVKHLWKKDKGSSVFVKNPAYIEQKEKTYLELRDSIIEDMKKYSPKYKKIKYKKTDESYCLVFDPSDIHIGKIASSFETGEDYNSQIAVNRVLEGMKGILTQAKGYNLDKIIFIAGNDILHVDNPANTTTSGTRQDVCGMWYDSFLMAKNLLVDVIETLMQIAPVEVVFNPSNHDFMSGFFLLDGISSWFRLSKDVTFNCSMAHRKYTRYHNNLIATTHMDGAKMDLLPILVAQESKMWDNTTRRYIYGHHVHHKIGKDYPGITLETLRSPSGADSWHHRNGYQHAPVAIEAFIHHKTQGQVCRMTYNF